MSLIFASCLHIHVQSQVADLDDEFAELLLTDFSDNFDAVPSDKVRLVICIPQYELLTYDSTAVGTCEYGLNSVEHVSSYKRLCGESLWPEKVSLSSVGAL